MSAFKFLHAADIHLDSPLRGLERYEDAPVEAFREAPRAAFENLVELAIEESVAFVLLAGDLYDGDWKDHHTGLFFVRQMRRLEAEGIPVFLVAGNHDATSEITRRLSLPPNVRLFDDTRPETAELEALGVAIHGQSFPRRSVPEDLSASYPLGEPDRFDIGLLHTSLDGRPGHADYAPCSVDGLRSRGYDYWALGHVHAREVVARDPWIVFPGNVQGRHVRETGPKGATLVSVEGRAVRAAEHRILDVVRWARVGVDAGTATRGEEVVEAARAALAEAVERAEGRPLAARLVITGASAAHPSLVSDPERWTLELREAVAADGGAVWLEQVRFETRRAVDLAAELSREDATGDLLRRIAALDQGAAALDQEAAALDQEAAALDDEADALASIGEGFDDLASKLPPALRRGDDGFDPTDEATLRARLPAVRDLLLSRLLDLEEAP